MKLTFSTVLFLIFLTLKLLGKISWSWWWITAPLWGTVAIILVFAFLAVTVAGFAQR